jgi:hypothetical protein
VFPGGLVLHWLTSSQWHPFQNTFLEDDSFEQLTAWVHNGGRLIITGDFSYDSDRQWTRTDRLKKLAGVQYVDANYPHVCRDQGSDVEVEFRRPVHSN